MSVINIPGFSDYFLEVARGNVSGAASVNKFGINPTIDTAADEDVWDGGGTWVAPTSAQLHTVVSSSTNDAAAGTGMRTVLVEGLDANWESQTETVTLNGTTGVSTVNSYIRVFRMYGLTFGSGAENAGAITATAATDATVTAQISAGAGQTLMAIYTVPAGKTAYLVGAGGSVNRVTASTTGNITMALMARFDASQSDSGWRVIWRGGLSLQGTSAANFKRVPPGPLPEKTDIKVRGINASVNGMTVGAWFDMIVVDNA